MKKYNQLGHVILGTTLRQMAAQISQDAEKTYVNFNFDIDPKWFPIFYTLACEGENSVVSIAKIIKQSHVSVSKVIKEMKKANLIDSHKSSKDSRISLITLNKRGQEMIPAMKEQCQAIDITMQQLTTDTGIDLWQALNVYQRHLQYHPISTRASEVHSTNSEEVVDTRIVDYAPIHQQAFKTLNEQWISQHWQLEAPDHNAINDPEGYIINQGGCILMAIKNNEVIGCCALIMMGQNCYELAKMAVSPKAKGQGIGFLLGEKIIERAKFLGAKRLYLESNSILKPAVALYSKLGFQHIVGASSPYERCDVQMELFLDQ